MNKQKAYVIGLDEDNLLHISYLIKLGEDENSDGVIVSRVEYGIENIDEATLIPNITTAKQIIQEIQKEHNYTTIQNRAPLTTMLEGKEFNLQKLKLYEIRIFNTYF